MKSSMRARKKKRILLVMPSIYKGGAEYFAVTLGKALIDKNVILHVGFKQTIENKTLIHDFIKIGAKYHRANLEEKEPSKEIMRDFLRRVILMVMLLIKTRPNIVIVVLPWHLWGLSLYFAPAIFNIFCTVIFQLAPYPVKFSKKRLKLIHWSKLRNQTWVAISHDNKLQLQKSFKLNSDSPLEVIYNGVDMSITNEEQKEKYRKKIRRNLGFNDMDQLIITVGRLSHQKGHKFIIPAIHTIIKSFPSVKFLWVGEGEMRVELEKLISDFQVSQYVHLAGERHDISDLLKGSDIFLFPTQFEGGQSFALSEAIANMVPVVTSNASGIPELITDKVHGIIFQKDSSEDLENKLLFALNNPTKMKEMATSAYEHFQKFSKENMLNAYFKVLDI